MTVYEFAKGLILEAGINVKKIMKWVKKKKKKKKQNRTVQMQRIPI